MSIIQRLSVLLVFADIMLGFPLSPLMLTLTERYYALVNYPLSEVIEPFYGVSMYTVGICLWGHIVIIPAFIMAYLCKKASVGKKFFLVGIITMMLMLIIAFNEHHFAVTAEQYYNPETVQSTMVEIDLEHLKSLQNDEDTVMIYFGRPGCAHCNEIKPDLDILVNNSHSTVYYYNTELDRENNPEQMQTVLDDYGVYSVPALVVRTNQGEIQEQYFDEDIVDYFLDTDRFSY